MSQKSSWGYLQRTWAQPIAAHASWFSLVFSFQYFLHIARSLLLASADLESSVGQLDMCFCQSVPSKLLRIIVWLQPLQSTQWDLNTHSLFNHFITPCSNVLQWFTRAQENQKKERTSRTLVIYKMYTWHLNHREWSLTFDIWDDTGSRRWICRICLKPAIASRTPHTISIHFSQSTKYSGQLSSICLSQRCIAMYMLCTCYMYPQVLGWSWMLLKVPRQKLKIDGDGMEMVWRWYQSPRLETDLKCEVSSTRISRPSAKASRKSRVEVSCSNFVCFDLVVECC